LHPKGLEIVTVSLDSTGGEAARPAIEAAAPEHPSLIDATHQMDALFGVVNVPSGIWIDEDGMIVRPPELAYSADLDLSGLAALELPPRMVDMFGEVGKISFQGETYVPALRDWIEHGSASRFALSPDEVMARSQARPPEEAEAAAHFELGAHLHGAGDTEGAVARFREAHRLAPDNWTYRRQAWVLASAGAIEGPLAPFWQGPVPGRESEWPYAGDYLTDLLRTGGENYYPQRDM
jgi:hypothetical protein